jgi:CDP-diacylglycerol pyrophosphatase
MLGHQTPRDTISLALNSEFGRSQNRLHIHIDCVGADVRTALHKAVKDHQPLGAAEQTARPPPLRADQADRRYRVIVDTEVLDKAVVTWA